MNDTYILYCVSIVIVSSFKLTKQNGYDLIESIRSFNDIHIKDTIIIPIIHFIYSLSSSLFLMLFGNSLKFTKIMEIIYKNLTKNQYAYLGIVIYSLEIFIYFILSVSYVFLLKEILGIFSNIQNGESSSLNIKVTFICMAIIVGILTLQGFFTDFILIKYKKKEKQLVSAFINYLQSFVIIYIVLYIISKLIEYKFNNKDVRDSANFKNIELFYKNFKNSENMKYLVEKLNTFSPIKHISKTHITITVLMQALLSIFLKIGYLKKYNIDNMIVKKQIISNVILLLSNSILIE